MLLGMSPLDTNRTQESLGFSEIQSSLRMVTAGLRALGLPKTISQNSIVSSDNHQTTDKCRPAKRRKLIRILGRGFTSRILIRFGGNRCSSWLSGQNALKSAAEFERLSRAVDASRTRSDLQFGRRPLLLADGRRVYRTAYPSRATCSWRRRRCSRSSAGRSRVRSAEETGTRGKPAQSAPVRCPAPTRSRGSAQHRFVE
jgi:hypothetical protein